MRAFLFLLAFTFLAHSAMAENEQLAQHLTRHLDKLDQPLVAACGKVGGEPHEIWWKDQSKPGHILKRLNVELNGEAKTIDFYSSNDREINSQIVQIKDGALICITGKIYSEPPRADLPDYSMNVTEIKAWENQ